VHLPFNFQLIELPWHAQVIGAAIDRYEELLPAHGWPNWVLGNHDNSRIVSRIGAAQARVAAMMLLTLRGTPTLYYGDEIAMRNVPIPPERVHDPFEKNVPGLGHGRDPERTPMQWSAKPNAGFTTGAAWLPLADDYQTTNVERQSSDEKSMLTLYRRLLDLRRREKGLSIGSYARVRADGDVLSYRRQFDRESRFHIILNLGPEPVVFGNSSLPRGRIALSTHLDRVGELTEEQFKLRGDEGLVIELAAD
jgi:alpha-glucosidase